MKIKNITKSDESREVKFSEIKKWYNTYLNTSKNTAFYHTFTNSYGLTTVPLFDTSNVTTMTSMFIGCSSLQNLPSFNTSKVTDLSSFCNGCVSIPEIPSSFDMSKNTTLYQSNDWKFGSNGEKEEIIVKKKSSKKKVIYESESDDDIIDKQPKPKPKHRY